MHSFMDPKISLTNTFPATGAASKDLPTEAI